MQRLTKFHLGYGAYFDHDFEMAQRKETPDPPPPPSERRP
jgi:hypothetical protein